MEQGPARKPALPTVSIAAAGAAGVSLAVVAVPWLRMSVEAPSLRVALETGGSLLAVTTVGLLLRQCGLRSRADHLWLTAGLVILALTSLTVAVLVVAGAWSPDEARYAMGGNLAGTLMLAIAAFAPSRRLRVSPRRILIGAGALGIVVVRAGLAAGRRRPGAARAERELADVPPRDRPRDRAGRHGGRADHRRRRAHTPRRAAAALGRGRGRARRLRQARLRALPARWAPTERAPRRRAARRRLGRPADRRASARCAPASACAPRPRSRASAAASPASCTTASRRNWPSSAAAPTRLAELPDGVEITEAADRALEDSRRAIEALVPPAHEPLHVALERLGARLATECGVEVQVNVRVATDVARRGPRRARADHLRGGPQRGQPRRRAPRARGPRRARRWPSGSSTTATASATAPTAVSASRATA